MSDASPSRERTDDRMTVPLVGLMLAVGIVVAECALLVRGFMATFGAGGIGLDLLADFAVHAVPAVASDLAVQAFGPRRWRRHVVARGLPAVLLAFITVHACGMVSTLAYAVVPVAALWALLTRWKWTVPVAAAIALWALRPALPQRHAPPQALASRPAAGPSIVLIVLDTVRRDHCSAYGYARETTPHLSALAARGVRFDGAYTTSCWSIPTHASLFTGLLPSQHGATMETYALSDSVETLAARLAQHGYETVGFSANPYVAQGTGFARGFHRFDEVWRPAWLARLLAGRQLWRRLWPGDVDKGGAAAVSGVRRWLESRDAQRPYFLFVNLMEAHAPYQDVPRRFQRAFTAPGLGRRDIEALGSLSHEAHFTGSRVPDEALGGTIDLLDGATTAADAVLGDLLALLGPEPATWVLSDHGELVGERTLFGHMTGLDEPLIRIPLVAAGSGLPEGAVVEAPVSIVDVAPTILALAGAPELPGAGTSLLPIAPASDSGGGRVLRAEHFRTTIGTQGWSLHRTPEELRSIRSRRGATISRGLKRVVAEDGSDEGFNLVTDPTESRPYPGPDTGLSAAVPQPGVPSAASPDLDPAQLEALRSLGYVR